MALKVCSTNIFNLETSSKHGIGVEDAFHQLCQHIMSRLQTGDIKIRFHSRNII